MPVSLFNPAIPCYASTVINGLEYCIMFSTPTFQTKNYQVYFDPQSGELAFARKGEPIMHLCGKLDKAEERALFRQDPQDPLSYLQTTTR